MFGDLWNAASNAVKSFLGGSTTTASAPKKSNVVATFKNQSTNVQGGSTTQTIQGGSKNTGAAIQGGSTKPIQGSSPVLQGGTAAALARAREQENLRVADLNRQAEVQRIAREAAIKEEKRRAKQAEVDVTVRKFDNARRVDAKNALDYIGKRVNLGDWRSLFDDSGNFKADEFKKDKNVFIPSESWLGLDSRYKSALDSWSKWYNSSEGTTQRAKDEFKKRARKIIDDTKKGGGGNWLQQTFDKVTFGGTRRAMDARGLAEKFGQETSTTQTKRYEDSTKTFLSEQARRSQQINAAKFGSWDEYNKAVDEYKKWEADEIDKLRFAAGAITGTLEGFNEKSKESIDNLPGKVGNWIQKNIVDGPIGSITGNLWKYTLGSGDENLPSLVTAPSRAVNFLGNTINPGGTKNMHDGKTVEGIEKGKNSWTQTLNQRNFNMEQPKKYSDKDFEAWYKTRNLSQWTADIKAGRIKESDVKKKFQDLYKAQTENDKSANWGVEFLADPLSLLGAPTKALSKSSKVTNFVSKAIKPIADSKFIQGTSKIIDSVKNTKAATWLTSEAKSPQQKYIEAVQNADKVTSQAQGKFLPKIREANEIAMKERGILKGKFDDSILEDFRMMAETGDDEAARWLQEMKNGDFSNKAKLKNWTRAGGVGSNPRLTNLKAVADKWSEFAEQMREGDKMSRMQTRFGKGKENSFYSPRTSYVDPEKYDFRKFKKNHKPQSAEALYRGMVDRYFKSDVIDHWGDTQKGKVTKADSRVRSMLDEYDSVTGGAAGEVDKAFSKTRTPYGRIRGLTDKYGPTALWKKSVLKYRPAWYVNNFLYNTQGAMLAGGPKAFVEQTRLMRPKNYRKAMAEMPEEIKTKVASEIGNGKIAKFGNATENISRMGAFRALKSKGMSDKDALKRVNSYLFDYTTKNYERPIKAVLPFYSFQKGLAKAAVKMPFDRPLAAKGYNTVDRQQKTQFEEQFAGVRPKLKEYGYSDAEIEEIYKSESKRYMGRLKIGDKYYNTPWNAFSEKGGFSGAGVSPWLSSAAEASSAKDHFGRDLIGGDGDFLSRIIDKFPIGGFARTTDKILNKDRTESWIGLEGSEGYGMTKQAQGYDPSKTNYKRSLDPGANFLQDLGAFFGMPRGVEFNADKLIDEKKLRKLKDEYFAVDWKSLDFPTQEAKRNEMFKKFGVTSDSFFKGELSKYDTPTAKFIKNMKEDAFNKSKKLFDEYGRQPEGTRNVWATQKLKELVDSNYFASNPFLKTFDWTNPDTIAKAYKKLDYDAAKKSGDWSAYQKKHGKTVKQVDYESAKKTGDWSAYTKKYGKTAKMLAIDKAVASGDWTEYANVYGVTRKETPYKFEGKFFKSKESMDRYIEGQFWAKYTEMDKVQRKEYLKANPQFNKRADWSSAQWDEWKLASKAEQKSKAMASSTFSDLFIKNLSQNNKLATPVLNKAARPKGKKLAFLSR
jgi:hypothetical protein